MKSRETTRQTSTNIAIGGVFSALALIAMFFTNIVPFGSYALPALAGALLIAVVEENGNKIALMVYVSVSLLSIFVVPDYEAIMMFVFLFGYYPVAKNQIEKLKSVFVQYIIKLALFVTAVAGVYYVLIYVLKIPDIMNDMGDFGRYTAIILLALGALVFLLYDYTLSKYIEIYRHRFRNRLPKR